MANEDVPYATNCGFYIGDRVELPDGTIGHIFSIVLKNVNFYAFGITFKVSVVRVGDELWIDSFLTRIK